MKELPSLLHDADAREDEKIINLLIEHDWAGYGLYWALVEKLFKATNNKLDYNLKALSYNLRATQELIQSVIEDFGLFEVKDNKFYSLSLLRRVDAVRNSRQKYSEMGKKGMRNRYDGDNPVITESDLRYNVNIPFVITESDLRYNENTSPVITESVLRYNEALTIECKDECNTNTNLNLKESKSNVECKLDSSKLGDSEATSDNNNTSDSVLNFRKWFRAYGFSPYTDSEVRCLGKWMPLTDAEQKYCLERVESYKALRPIPERRHNPLNYLEKKMFNDDSLHKRATTNKVSESVKNCFDADLTNNSEQIRNKPIILEV